MNLDLKNINFSFPKKTVLKDVNIFFKEGQIHGLLGENGAGKSTLANIICGELIPSSGAMLLNNEPVVLNSSKDAISQGICYVHQRPMLCENITVYENLLLGLHLPLNPKKRHLAKKSIQSFAATIIPGVNLKSLLVNISSDIRFFISLTGALLKKPQILVLDEPSALLNPEQIDFLYQKLQALSKQGMNIIVITHNLDEAEKYCSDTFILKKQHSAEYESHLLETKKALYQKDSIAFKWQNISCKTRNHIPLKNLNFQVQTGEISLIQGLGEDGLSLLEDIVCGMAAFNVTGNLQITQNNQTKIWNYAKKFTARDLRYKTGIRTGIIPTNKKYRGSNPELSVKQILTSSQNACSAGELIQKSNINIEENEKAQNLSGGMLQRLIINREIAENPQLIILCNPLQGLDHQSEENLCQRIQELKDQNCAILILSGADFPAALCTNIYSLKKGEITKC